MKKLKFMLAAATALGLATASQAATKPGVRTLATENFNAKAVGAFTASDEWSVALADDNESEIVAKDASDNYLKVSVGTDPLLRAIDYSSSAAQAVDISTEALNIDTMVQFTVTPATDTVEAGASDKLMIYLKESETNELGVATTNLMVKALEFRARAWDEDNEDWVEGTSNVTDVVAVNLDGTAAMVTPNTWHQLTVKTCTIGGETMFKVYLDQAQLKPSQVLKTGATGEDAYLFPSLLAGSGSTTLQYVGFAGEGAVDDLVFTQDTTLSSLDFTFAWPTGFTPISYTIDGGEAVAFASSATSPVVLRDTIYPDSVVKFLFQNADGVQKEMSVVASLEDDGLNAEDATFGWADYLGEAVDGAYEIDTAAELVLFQKGVFSGLATASTTFKQTANIDMTGVADFYGIGWFKSSTAYLSLPNGVTLSGDKKSTTDIPFAGTYDGQGYTISNVTLVRHNYGGVFNCVSGTVKNLTVQNLGFNDTTTASANGDLEWGCGIVGNAQGNAVLENLISAGTVWGNNANHNIAGIAVRAQDNATIKGCVNNVAIQSASKRLGGIIAFTGTTTENHAVTIVGCTNNAAISSTDGTRGVGGIISSPETWSKDVASSIINGTIIKDCVDFGSETAGANGFTGAIVGSLGVNQNASYTDAGGNTFRASANMVGKRNYGTNPDKEIVGLAYAVPATINNEDYLTTVKEADLAAGNTYTLVANATPTFALAALGDFIAFKKGSFDLTDTGITYAGGKVTSATADGVTTYTAAALATVTVTVTGGANATAAWTVNGESVATAPATLTEGDTYAVTYTAVQGYAFAEGAVTSASGTAGTEAIAITIANAIEVQQTGWVDDPTTIDEGTTAGAQYAALAGTDLANADAKKLTVWAKANNVAFTDATAGAAGYVEAFLLNCAPTAAAVAAEKEAFVLDIEIVNDVVTIKLPEGKTYNGTLQMKGSTDLTTWTNATATTGFKFFKYELSL